MSPCPCKGRAVPRARSSAPRIPRSTANGSTIFTDVRGHTVTGLGTSPQITTAQGITGGASFAAAGTSYLSTPQASEFAVGSNSFTVEAWVYPQPLANAAATQGIVAQQLFDITTEGGLCLCVQNGQLVGNLTDANGNLTGVTGPTLAANTWSHVALVGTPGTLTLYVNGQSAGSTARGAAQNLSPLPLTIGADGSGAGIFAGDIDEVRFTNGVARYSANFSPSAPYPDNDIGSGNTGANSTTQTYHLSAGQQAGATISASAGSAIAINLGSVATTPSGGSVSLTLANPDGSQLASTNVNDGTTTASFISPVLTQSGTYVLNINPGANAASLNASLSIVGPLSVTVTSPNNGATYTPDNVSLSAAVTEQNGAISQVSYYNGTTLLGTATQAPYGIDFKDMAPGSYTLTAQATDVFGRTATSTPISITVVANGAGGGSNPEVVYDIQTDQIGTPRMVTDQGSNVIWQWNNQDPFGNNLPNQDPNGIGNSFVFNLRLPGQYFDIETGTFYNYFRDYDPQTGRYPESDPKGLAGGSFSTYGYVGANPIAYSDPVGLVRWSGNMFIGGIIEPFGAVFAEATLYSECVNGKRMKIEIMAEGPAAGLGVKVSATVGDISFEDYNIGLYPDGFNGKFTEISGAVTAGALPLGRASRIGPGLPGIGVGVGIVQFGSNFSDPLPPGAVFGRDQSASGGVGSARVTSVEIMSCTCSKK